MIAEGQIYRLKSGLAVVILRYEKPHGFTAMVVGGAKMSGLRLHG